MGQCQYKQDYALQMAEFLPVNRPLVRDLILDMNNSSALSYNDLPSLPTQEWYGVVLMHHMFSPNSQDALQHSEADRNEEDITKRIMQAGHSGHHLAQPRCPSSSQTSRLLTSNGLTSRDRPVGGTCAPFSRGCLCCGTLRCPRSQMSAL